MCKVQTDVDATNLFDAVNKHRGDGEGNVEKYQLKQPVVLVR